MGIVGIHTPKKKGYRSIYLRNDYGFIEGDEVLFKITEEKFVITKPTLDNVAKVSKITLGFCPTFRIYESDWADGDYLIDDDESNEDQLVIYREDLIETE